MTVGSINVDKLGNEGRGDFYFEDGTAILQKDGTVFKIHKAFVQRLSPKFFANAGGIVEINEMISQGVPVYDLKSTSIGVDGLRTIFAHLYLRIADAPFTHVLHLYVATSPDLASMRSVYGLAAKYLNEILNTNPLNVDFTDIKTIQAALNCTSSTASPELNASLEKALYYAYIVSDTVIYPDQDVPPDTNQHRLSTTEAHITKHLMTRITDFFSPTIFQPVNGSHMACTDIFAKHWVALAVEPALEDGGLCDTFRTLNRLASLAWVDEADGDGVGEGDGNKVKKVVSVCDECLKRVREEWEEEALNIWAKIGEWIEEAKQISKESSPS